MQNIFFNDEVLDIEKRIYTSLKIPTLLMMENAGANAADLITKKISGKFSGTICIITGKGNNAGDGFVIARHLLNENISVKLIMLFRPDEIKGDAFVNYSVLKNIDNDKLEIIYCKDYKALNKEFVNDRQIIVDSIFGVGFKGEPDKRIKDIIDCINEKENKFIFSIDVPSGLLNYNQKSDSVRADMTLTMGAKKFGTMFYKGRENSGRTEVINIGIPEEEFTINNFRKIYQTEEGDVRKLIPKKGINSNKYSNGKVFILSGSIGLTGAAFLCSMSALRMGSGTVITGIPKSLNEIMEVKLTEVMTLPLPETKDFSLSLKCYDEIKKKLSWADAVLIGPGLSKNEETMELVRKIVTENNLNYVIDADAISAFKGNLNLLKNKKIIMTPHLGEFSNLLGKDNEEVKNNFYELSKNFVKEYKITLVLKNSPTVITNGAEFYINSTGKENLATAGTGDVLSGIIASLLSRSGDLTGSAIAGTFIHGMCGDRLYDTRGISTIAGDLINELPDVIKYLTEI